MQKPDFEKMENKDAIQQETFSAPRTREYQLTQEDVDQLKADSEGGYCSQGLILQPFGNEWGKGVKISTQDLKVGKFFQIH